MEHKTEWILAIAVTLLVACVIISELLGMPKEDVINLTGPDYTNQNNVVTILLVLSPGVLICGVYIWWMCRNSDKAKEKGGF